MNIVTIMNYDWSNKNNIRLCLTWLHYANVNLLTTDTVYVYSNKRLHSEIYEAFADFRCNIKSVIYPYVEDDTIVHFGVQHNLYVTNHNYRYKLNVISNIKFPFLFVDCDALIIDNISELQRIFDSTKDSVFFVDHGGDDPIALKQSGKFINSGVFINNDPFHKVLNFAKITNYSKKIGFFPTFKDGTPIPGTDQAIIKSYLDHVNYNYHHDDFDYRYNTYSGDHNKSNNAKIVHYWGLQKEERFPYI